MFLIFPTNAARDGAQGLFDFFNAATHAATDDHTVSALAPSIDWDIVGVDSNELAEFVDELMDALYPNQLLSAPTTTASAVTNSIIQTLLSGRTTSISLS
mgnify:CR=1 FL=1